MVKKEKKSEQCLPFARNGDGAEIDWKRYEGTFWSDGLGYTDVCICQNSSNGIFNINAFTICKYHPKNRTVNKY